MIFGTVMTLGGIITVHVPPEVLAPKCKKQVRVKKIDES